MNYNNNWMRSQQYVIVAPAIITNDYANIAVVNDLVNLPLATNSRSLIGQAFEKSTDFQEIVLLKNNCGMGYNNISSPNCYGVCKQPLPLIQYPALPRESFGFVYPQPADFSGDLNRMSLNLNSAFQVEMNNNNIHYRSIDERNQNLDQKDFWMVQYKMNHETKRQNTVYVCRFPGCGKEFKKKWNYTEHFKSHSHAKPFQCPECGKLFSQKGSMIKHIKTRSSKGNDHGLSKIQNASQKSEPTI